MIYRMIFTFTVSNINSDPIEYNGRVSQREYDEK